MGKQRQRRGVDSPVRVRVGEYPPNYFTKNGEPFGISIDILRQISARTGVNFEFVVPSGPFAKDLAGLVATDL